MSPRASRTRSLHALRRRSDRFRFRCLRVWIFLGKRPVVGRIFRLAEPVMGRLMAGLLRRQADDVERNAERVRDLDPELSRELRVQAAELRQQAREAD